MRSCVRPDTTSLTPEIRHVTALQSSGTRYNTWFSTLSVQQGNKGLCQQRRWRRWDNKRVASGVEMSHHSIRKKMEHQLVVPNQQTRRMTQPFPRMPNRNTTLRSRARLQSSLSCAWPQGNKQATRRASTERRARRPLHMRLTTQTKRAPPSWTHLL